MKKPNAKDRILQTAGGLFHEKGFSGVGINEIIEKAETAKATFYQHFPSKESLCMAWLEAIHEFSETIRKDICHSGECAVEKVNRYFALLEEFMTKSDFRGCPYSNTGAVVSEECCGIREKIEEHKLSIRRFFLSLAREIAPSDQRAQKLGDALFLLYSGAATEAQNLRSLWPVLAAQDAARLYCEMALQNP